MFRFLIISSFLLLLVFSSNAQSMSSKNVLDNLQPYWVFLNDLAKDIKTVTGTSYKPKLMQSFTFIQLELIDDEEQIFLQIQYRTQYKAKELYLTLYDFYCDDEKLKKSLENKINQQLGPFEWKSNPSSNFKLNAEQKKYLEIADRIASLGNDINAHPSDYEQIIIQPQLIKLTQGNHLYSTSIDHQDSYYLRDLAFSIPLSTKTKKHEKMLIGIYYIGAMEISFEDGSAKSQQGAGNRIMAQLEQEIKRYK